MAKRGAGDQITRDDYDESRGGDEDDPGQRDAPLAPVEGRKIRGLPKRTGSAAAAPAPAAPAAPTPAPVEAPKPAFGGFSFGSTPAPSQPAPSASPFGSSFSFGSSSTPAPAAPAIASSTSTSTPAPAAAASPFSGFSFGAKPATSAAPAAPSSATPSTFGASSGSNSNPFSFGAKPAASALVASAPAPPAAASPFGGFSFGASTGGTTTGGFGAQSTPANGQKRSAEEDKESSAPAAKKTFGSFGSTPTSTSFGSTSIAKTPATEATTSTAHKPAENGQVENGTKDAPSKSSSSIEPTLSSPPPEGEVKYYTALRGLNVAMLSFLTSTLETNSFVDLGEILPLLAAQYTKHLNEVSTTSGYKPPSTEASSSTASSSAPKAPEPAKEAPKKPQATMPSAPTGGFTFGGQTSTSTPSSSSSGAKGFTPSLPAAGSSGGSTPFSFSFGTASKPAETPKKPSADVTKTIQDAIAGKSGEEPAKEAVKPFTFGSTSTPGSSSTPKSGSGLFSFAPSGPLHPSTPGAKSFSPSPNLENASSSTPPSVKLGKFGPGGSAPQLSFGGATSSPATPGGGKVTGFAFGAPSSGSGGFNIGSGGSGFQSPAPASTASKDKPATPSFSFGSTNISSTADKPASSGFSFGTPSSSSTFTFGAPSGSPSFSFGQSTSKPASQTSGFSFGAPPASTPAPVAPAPATDDAPADGADATAGASEETQASAEPSVNLAESSGVGEEGEETLFHNRTKLFKFANGKMEAVGLGSIKLKKNTETGKRRLLMRTDGNGSIILNMSLNDKLDPQAGEKNSARFLGFDLEGNPTTYTLKMKDERMINDFVSAVKKEVEEMKKA